MLEYRRRNKKEIGTFNSIEESVVPLLTYCNWSYAPSYHIDVKTLKKILSNFDEAYIPYYLRIFNETPKQVVQSFLEQFHISKNSLESICNNLLDNGFKVKNVNL